MIKATDLAIIGGGPAGLSAAKVASDAGIDVCLIDEQATVGGQIYRNIEAAKPAMSAVLGDDYKAGLPLLAAFEKSNVTHINNATVWQITPQRKIYYSKDGAGQQLVAKNIIIATGAMERAMPFPGWTLPGILTAGAGQIMLKQSQLVPDAPIILLGSGPLLYLLALQYLRAGVKLSALVETTPLSNFKAAMRHLPHLWSGFGYMVQGLAMMRKIHAAGVPWYRRACDLKAGGDGRVEYITFRSGGRKVKIASNLVLIHQGVVANVQISQALCLEHQWNDVSRSWTVKRDQWGMSTVDNIYVVGDGAAILGADAARDSGALAALAVAQGLNALPLSEVEKRAAILRKKLTRQRNIRKILDSLYAPAHEFLVPADETVVCRCENVKACAIRNYIAVGAIGPNQIKAFSRCGMGPCQGRQCGLSVGEIIAGTRNIPVSQVGHSKIRPPIKPVTLGALANLK